MIKRVGGGVAVLLWAAQSWAGDVAVSDASVRATAPGQDSAAVSLVITTPKDARLVGVSSPAATRGEIHVMKHENGMMTMQEVDALALPAKQEVRLGHGSHIMLVGLKQPLKAGSSVPLTLTIEYADKRRETIEVKAEVTPLTAGHHEMHDMHDMGTMH